MSRPSPLAWEDIVERREVLPRWVDRAGMLLAPGWFRRMPWLNPLSARLEGGSTRFGWRMVISLPAAVVICLETAALLFLTAPRGHVWWVVLLMAELSLLGVAAWATVGLCVHAAVRRWVDGGGLAHLSVTPLQPGEILAGLIVRPVVASVGLVVPMSVPLVVYLGQLVHQIATSPRPAERIEEIICVVALIILLWVRVWVVRMVSVAAGVRALAAAIMIQAPGESRIRLLTDAMWVLVPGVGVMLVCPCLFYAGTLFWFGLAEENARKTLYWLSQHARFWAGVRDGDFPVPARWPTPEVPKPIGPHPVLGG